jgi:hypothetical protein
LVAGGVLYARPNILYALIHWSKMDLGNISRPPPTETDNNMQQKIERLESRLEDAQNDAIRDRLLKLEIKDLVSSSARSGTPAADPMSQSNKSTDDTQLLPGGMDLMSLAMGDMTAMEAPPPKEDNEGEDDDPLHAVQVKVRTPRKRKTKKKTAEVDLLESDDELEPIGTGFFHSKGAPKEGAKAVDEAALGNELLQMKLDRTIERNIDETSDIFRSMLERDAIEFAPSDVPLQITTIRGNMAFLRDSAFFIEDESKASDPKGLEEWLDKIKAKADAAVKSTSAKMDIGQLDAVFLLAAGFNTDIDIQSVIDKLKTAVNNVEVTVDDDAFYDINQRMADLAKIDPETLTQNTINDVVNQHLLPAMYMRHVLYMAYFNFLFNNKMKDKALSKAADQNLDERMYALLKYLLTIRMKLDQGPMDIDRFFEGLLKYFVIYHFRMILTIDAFFRTVQNKEAEAKYVAGPLESWWTKNFEVKSECATQKSRVLRALGIPDTEFENACAVQDQTGRGQTWWEYFTSFSLMSDKPRPAP